MTPLRSALARFGRHETFLLVVLAIEWFAFNAAGPRFASTDNTMDILRHSTEIGLLALALTPIILTGGIDLSVGSLLGLCAVVFGKLWRDAGLGIVPAAGVTLLIGTLAGAFNASLITRLQLPPLIVTLGTLWLFRGLAEALTHGVDTFTGFPATLLFWGQSGWGHVPAQLPILLLAVATFWTLIHTTTFGRSLRAIGFAPEGARHAGLPVQRHLTFVYTLAGTIVALAAIIYTARLGQAKADAGTGYELLAITAVVLGGTSIFGGTGSIHGTLLGVASLAILNNGLVHARQPREVAGLLTGLLLIAALAGPLLLRHLSTLRTRTPPP